MAPEAKDGLERKIEEAVTNHLRKSRNNPKTAVRTLMEENHDLREERRELKTKLAAFPEGAVVMSADQTKMFDSLKAAGIDTPEKLTAHVGKVAELQGQLDDRNKQDTISQIAERAGFPVRTLIDLAKARDLEVSEVEVTETVDGKKETKKIAAVKKKGDKEPIHLSDFIKSDAPEYEALFTDGTTTTTTTPEKKRVPGQTTTTKTTKSGGKEEGGLVDKFLKQNKERAEAPNPLRPKAATT